MKANSQGQTHQSGSHTRGSSQPPESSEATKTSSTQQRSKSTSHSHAHQHSNARPQSSGKAQGHASSNTGASASVSNAIGHYILGKALGEGTFGKVKLGTHVLTGEKVAVKVLEKSKIKDKKDIERISREIKILKQLHHPNVVQIYEIIETEKDLYLVMEFASGGELFDLIVQNQKLKERTASRYLQELLAGVHYIHKLGICHRDLKPENLLIDFDGSLKVVDFGLSNMYEPGQTLKTACGSPCYAAPEMIAGNRYHGLKSDIWSCGVVLYAMLCGYLPFEDQKTSNLYKKILNADYNLPKFLSPEAKDIISKIFQTDPEKRIDIEGLKNHPWYRLHQPENQAYNYHNMRRSVNDKLVLKLEASLGFSVESVTKAVENNKHNHLSATYYLLFKKYAQQNYRANQGQQKSITSTSRQTTQIADKKQPSPSKQRSTSATDYDSKISANSGAKYQKARAKNPINELNPKEKDRLTAPVQDQLVLKNHRREQSANATAGRTHGAWGHVEDERRTESCERPAAIDDYEIVFSKPQNPTSSTIENSRHGQKSGNYPQRSAFVSPSPDPCTKSRRKQSVNQPKSSSTSYQPKPSDQKPINGALNLSNVRQQPFQQQSTPSQSQQRTAATRSSQRAQPPNPESKLSTNTQNQKSAEKKSSMPPSKSTTPVQSSNQQSKDPQVHRKTKSVMADTNQTQQVNWRTTQETHIGGNEKSGDTQGKNSFSQTQKIRLSKGAEHSRAQSSNLKTTHGSRASNGETSKISNLLDNLNMLTQKTYFDSIVSNQQPSSNLDFSNTQVISKSSKGQYAEIEGTQTSKETISVKASTHTGTSKYDQIKKQQTQEYTNSSKLNRLESGQSNGARSEIQRKEDVMSNQNTNRSPKHNQKEQMRKSLGQPDNYSKSRKQNNYSLISDTEKLQQQIMNRTLDGGSNVEIKIPVNPVTGGVNKSLFYGTQPMHSHLQNLRNDKEHVQNQSVQNQTKNQIFTSQTGNTQQSERDRLNASKVEAWSDLQNAQQTQSKAGKIVSTSSYRSESNPKAVSQHSKGQSASKHTRNGQNTLIGNKQPSILHSSANQAHIDAQMSQVNSPGLPPGYNHSFENQSQPTAGDQNRYAHQKLSQSYNTGHKHVYASTQNNTIEQPNLTVSNQNSSEARQQPPHSLSVVQNPGYRKSNKPEIKTRSYSISGSGNAVTPGHQARKSHDCRDKLNQSQNVSSAHYRFGTTSSINKERKSSLQPTAHNNGAQTTKHRSSSINHNPSHQPSRMSAKEVQEQLSSSQIVKNLDSRRPGSSVPTQKKSQSRQGRADSMQLSIPNDRQMFQSITYHSNQMADGEVFNQSFSNAPNSQSNYNKRKQQTITHLLNSTEGLKQYALNKNLARKGDDQGSTGMSMQSNNLFMTGGAAKGNASQTKQGAMMTSDLSLSIKDMYKQLQNGGSIGTHDTKSYLTGGQMHPQQQLQATHMPHGGKNLNQTAQINMKHVTDEPFSLNSTQNMSNTIQNQSYLSDLFKQKMTSKPQEVIQITPTSAQTPGQRNNNPSSSIFSPASKNRAQSGKPVQQSQPMSQTNFIQRDYSKQQPSTHIPPQQSQYSHTQQTANLLNQLVQQNNYTQQNSGHTMNHIAGNYSKNLNLTSSHDMGGSNYMGINSSYTPTSATMANNFMIQPQLPQNNNLFMQQYQIQNQQPQYSQNSQQIHQQPYYQPAQINLSGVVPPPSNQTKRLDNQNAPSYTYMAAQQLADLSNFQHRDEKMR